MKCFKLLCLCTSMMVTGPLASCSNPNSAQTIDARIPCMLTVLHGTPHVSNSMVGVVTKNGSKHPFVQYYYSANGPAWRSGTVRFIGSKGALTENTITYATTINGLFTPGTQPASYGTDIVTKRWRQQCKVQSIVFSV